MQIYPLVDKLRFPNVININHEHFGILIFAPLQKREVISKQSKVRIGIPRETHPLIDAGRYSLE